MAWNCKTKAITHNCQFRTPNPVRWGRQKWQMWWVLCLCFTESTTSPTFSQSENLNSVLSEHVLDLPVIRVYRMRTVYSMGIKTFHMRKEIFKVGNQKPKCSPLQGIEPGSSCIVVWQLKQQEKVHPWRKPNPGLCGRKPALSLWLSILSQHTFVPWIIEVRSHLVAKLSPNFGYRWQEFKFQNRIMFSDKEGKGSLFSK